MNNSETILNELKETAPALIELQGINVYSVPEGYFTGFSISVIDHLHETTLPRTGALSFQVPDGYFEQLAGNILLKIKSLDQADAGILAAIGNKNVFSVPEGYFVQFPINTLKKVHPATAKVISMPRRTSFARYAAAAVISGLMGLALFTGLNKHESTVSTAPLLASVYSKAQKIIEAGSFDQELQNVTDEEIVGYLQNNGQDVKAALVASVTDVKDLPSEDAYITNENTLNNILKDLDLNTLSN